MQTLFMRHSSHHLLGVLLVTVLLFMNCSATKKSASISEYKFDLVDLVDPLVDAANSRWFFFNSATRPFGMVNLSPDMNINGAWNSGYRYNEDTIRAFSHIHAWQMSGVPVFPTTGSFRGHLGADVYGSAYSHDNEQVRPGYHQIYLDTYGIDAELTATTRVGFHRYTFPASPESHIQVDLSTFLGPSDTQYGSVTFVDGNRMEGYAVMGPTRRRPKPIQVFFVMDLNKDDLQFGAWKDGEILEGKDKVEGKKIGAFVSFPTQENEKVLMKVSISYSSLDQARNNMEMELAHWDFDQVVKDSRDDWNQWLGKIEVKGAEPNDRRRFYTDLWHALQGRRIISDFSGAYCDMTGPERRVGQIPLDDKGKPQFNHYNSDSFWGAQWTINTLWQLVYPRVAEEFVQSMLLMYKDGGLVPRGPSGGNYTNVMTGASSTPFVVAAYMKGIRGFDAELAYQALKKNHMPGGMMGRSGYEHNSARGGGLEYYIDQGYVPFPLPNGGHGGHEDGSGQTLEYAYQDGCLSQFAKALGHRDDYTYFSNRSKNYKNVWYADKGWMWIKDVEGLWGQPFDELAFSEGFVESTAAQSTWFVPHDIPGLADLMGGEEPLIKKLDASFKAAEKHDFTAGKSHDKETEESNRHIYINYGNQPSMQTAYIFNYVGAPWLTQYWGRKITEKVYSGLSPNFGYSGDEDQGLMGSLAVLMKMGLFSMNGGAASEPTYEIGSPIFDEVKIHLDPDYYSTGEFVIHVENQSADNVYIQSASWNSKSLDRAFLWHKEVVEGGELKLKLGPNPNKRWAIETRPPSMK